MNKRSYHVNPIYKAYRSKTHFCNEPQALVNICLTCPLPDCNPNNCARYKTAQLRLMCKIFPLVDLEVPEPVREPCKCDGCPFGTDVSGKVFCPLIQGTCVKEE